MESATTSLRALLSLAGISITDSDCVLSHEQLVRLGALLLDPSWIDAQTSCIAGGALSALAQGSGTTVPAPQPPAGPDHEAFLLIAGSGGLLALLAAGGPAGYHTRVITDQRAVDHVALVLWQFGGHASPLDLACGEADQRARVAALITGLLADADFRALNLADLLPSESIWLETAQALAPRADAAALAAIPSLQSLLAQSGYSRALIGQLDPAQQLWAVAATAASAPAQLSLRDGVLADVLRLGQPASVAASAYQPGAWPADDIRAWAAGDPFLAIPLLRDRQVFGLLLAAGERPASESARANLVGLSVLLGAYLGDTPIAAAPARPAQPNSSIPRSTTNGRPSLPDATARRTRAEAAPLDSALLEYLSDGVLIANARGRIVAGNRLAARALGLAGDIVGQSLVEGDAWVLGALLGEAIMGAIDEPRDVLLPGDRPARVMVVAAGPELWAFVLYLPGVVQEAQ